MIELASPRFPVENVFVPFFYTKKEELRKLGELLGVYRRLKEKPIYAK